MPHDRCAAGGVGIDVIVLTAGLYKLPFSYIDQTRFLNNHADHDGGAIRLLDGVVTLHQSCLVGNSANALSHLSAPGNQPVNATNNWWGATDGPGGVASGSGDGVSAAVIFSPFLANSILECPNKVQTSTGTIYSDFYAFYIAGVEP